MSNSLTKPEYTDVSDAIEKEKNVEILNALSGDLSVMRQSMLFGLLEGLAYNINRKNRILKCLNLEIPTINMNQGYAEDKHLVFDFTGKRTADYWDQANKNSDVFYLKGLVKALMERLGLQD